VLASVRERFDAMVRAELARAEPGSAPAPDGTDEGAHHWVRLLTLDAAPVDPTGPTDPTDLDIEAVCERAWAKVASALGWGREDEG
jgi:hypothetical protein